MALRRRKSLPRGNDCLLFTLLLNLNVQKRRYTFATWIITILIIFYIIIKYWRENIFNLSGSSGFRTSLVDRCTYGIVRCRVPVMEKVDDHCARVSRAVKSNRKGERAHDTQQWTISIDASGPRCKLSVLWLQSCICDSLNQDVTTVSSYARLFFSRARDGASSILFSYCRFECGFYSFYHDGTTTLISNTHLVFGCVNLNVH